MNTQRGFAYAYVSIGIGVVLLGALGFVFWQNFTHNQPAPTNVAASNNETKTLNDPIKQSETKTYQSNDYSFDYIADSWRVEEESYNSEMPNDITPVVKTFDYTSTTGLGVDNGASVAIYVTRTGQTLQEVKDNARKFQGPIQNYKDMTVAGEDAFIYSSGYEGMRYHTIFMHDGLQYDLVYQYAGNNAATHQDGYNEIVKSFEFK